MQEARKGVVVVEEAAEQTVVAAEVALACKGAVFVQVVVVASVEIAPDNKIGDNDLWITTRTH